MKPLACEPLYPDAHEHAGRADEYRELAMALINDALKWLECAEQYEHRLRLLTDRRFFAEHHFRWKHYLHAAARHHESLERDVAWFRSCDGYALWVCATQLTDAQADAVQSKYLSRASQLLAKYRRALNTASALRETR